MNIFNSLGSNYNLNFVLQSLFLNPDQNSSLKLKGFLKTKYQAEQVILFYKGREALHFALKALKLDPSQQVAITGFTCFALYQAVVDANLKPILLDIDSSLNFQAQTLKKALRENPSIKAVIIQNSLGYPQNILDIKKLCQDNQLILIEDLAHCIGTKYSTQDEAGTIGDITCFSFSQDKVIDAVSGGALVIRNKKLIVNETQLPTPSNQKQFIDHLYPFLTYLIRNTYSFTLGKILHQVFKTFHLLSQPLSKDSNHPRSLPPWYCQLALNQFNCLEPNLSHRKKIATLYSKLLNRKILSSKIVSQIPNSANLRLPIFVQNPSSLIKFLKRSGIFVSDIWYDSPIAPKIYLSQTSYNHSLPNSKNFCSKIINLPTHLNISAKQAQQIAQKVNLWLNQ